MRKVLISLVVLVTILTINLYSQQLPLYSQYMLNDFFINPAIAGSKQYSPVLVSIHKQWVGINDSPSTQTLSGHTMLSNNNVGLGAIIFNDDFGPESHLGLMAIYSYHFHIDRLNKISLGLSAIAFQYKMDQRFFHLTVYDDPAITYMVEKTIVPDATFGAYAYGKRYWGGITASHLFQSKLKINRNVDENKMVRHYFAMAGYRFLFPNSPQFEIEPSFLMKTTEVTPPQFDINLKIFYDKDYWFGMSIRPGDSFVACLGFKHNQYYFGYAYDFTFSDLSAYTIGSQEIIFGMNIGENVRRSRSFF
ncbi:MAG TPA: type IX secretion system membrane protein PorP/SprF [Bacteroidales bacterium]|nr:type IX secretion system membrane protein PorP/SprF [Bacteroidales bacterium]HUM32446.1 type IX secretion system membrane protein PorP/SprF [Bacteroidales bacterium]